ncbi:uncharacterized protein MYCGRDRAFT_43323, partial [Zymoseptoria tritici IPO323]
ADWSFVPGGGRNLYAIGMDQEDDVSPYIVSWSMDTHNCTTVGRVQGLTLPNQSNFGATYASAAGDLYGTEDLSGRIYRFNIRSPNNWTLMATGPANTNNDGARCILNTEPVY